MLVDNGSSDESLDLARAAETPFAISIVANSRNEAFADACNQGAELASGKLLLFLNNDIEPFERGWLRELVACLRQTGAGIAGATLIEREERGRFEHGFAVQQRGIVFRDDAGTMRSAYRGHGADPLGGASSAWTSSPWPSAAPAA